jgi:hypothetical protein
MLNVSSLSLQKKPLKKTSNSFFVNPLLEFSTNIPTIDPIKNVIFANPLLEFNLIPTASSTSFFANPLLEFNIIPSTAASIFFSNRSIESQIPASIKTAQESVLGCLTKIDTLKHILQSFLRTEYDDAITYNNELKKKTSINIKKLENYTSTPDIIPNISYTVSAQEISDAIGDIILDPRGVDRYINKYIFCVKKYESNICNVYKQLELELFGSIWKCELANGAIKDNDICHVMANFPLTYVKCMLKIIILAIKYRIYATLVLRSIDRKHSSFLAKLINTYMFYVNSMNSVDKPLPTFCGYFDRKKSHAF